MTRPSSGNRCGHVATSRRLFDLPVGHRPRPKILIVLGRAVEDYYDHPEKTLPSLNAANHSDRKQRSERREACLLLLRAVIHYTDIASLEVGVPGPMAQSGVSLSHVWLV